MLIPFSTEYYIQKAIKEGYSLEHIRMVLACENMWHKIIHEKKQFRKVFWQYLEMAKDGHLPSSTKHISKLKITYSQYKNRLI